MARSRLEDVRRAFARWRRGKQRPSDPVPEELWARAVEAAQDHGPTRTARVLGLNHSALKQRIQRATPSPVPEFVELPLGLMSARESTLELEDQAGARLRLVLPGAKPHEVAAAARELWGARP